jgi:flagellar biosynthetic protein FliO
MNALMNSFKNWFERSSQKQKYTAVLLAFSLMSTLGLLLLKGSSGAMDDPLQSSPFYFIGVFAKLAVVLLLILACSAIFRRWSQPGTQGRKNRQMQVIETVRLSPKQALHLITVGDHQLLIGATDQNVSLLTPVALDVAAPEMRIEQPALGTDFAALFQAVNFRSPVETPSKS